MNVKKLLEIASIAEGRRIPYDISDLNQYYSSSKDHFFKLHEMDLVHVLRAFSKTLDELQLERETPREHRYMRTMIKGEPDQTVTYVGYQLIMSPYGIQFSDNEDKLTMEQLEERHDFEQGDTFVLYTDTEVKLCLKKDRDKKRG